MINPDTLVDSVRDKLRLIASLVALVGNTNRINSYADGDSSMLRSIFTMVKPSILVAWRGMEPGDADAVIQYRQQISIFVRTDTGQRFGAYMDSIINGIPPAASRAPFSNPDDVNSSFDMIGIPLCARVTDENSVDYLEIQITYGQKIEQ